MANNLLVDWLNKKPKATLKNAQTVVNNNTASNMQNITTPTINAGSVAGVQQVNKPTLQVSAPLTTTNVKSSIQSNNPAFNNWALVTAQNQPSRFIGFQQQPQVANTVLDRTPNERQGLSWKKLTTTWYNYVPSEVSKAESSNRAEENRYRTMSEAFYDLQGTLYNKWKVLGENELRQKFPEFKDLDINILNELQNELLPIVSSGKWVDADQISQIYPELLKGKELKDINTVKENVQKGNDRYKGWEKAIQKVAKWDVEGMSSEWVQSVQDAKAIWQAVQAVKKDWVIWGGTDYEILRELYQRDPEIKRLMDDFNSRELTEKDKIIWGREDANKIGQLFRGATDWLRKDDEFMKSDEELESLKNKAKAMEDDYWGQVAWTARVGLRSTADTWEKFIYRMSQDAKLWTIEDIDDYLKQSEENERNVAEYNASVNRETENLAQNTINPDVRNYYNNHSMSRSIALWDVPWFFLQSTKSAAENIDMPIIIAAWVVAPEVVLPLMATDTYVRESEDAFETLLENWAGYDDAEQWAVIVWVASTAVEIYLERLLWWVETTASRTIRDALMKDISKKTTEMVAERWLVDLAKRGLTTQLRSSMEEWLEEIVQQSIQNYAVSKYNPDVKITDGLREAFEWWFFNPMNLLAGGGEIASNVDVNALNQWAYNAWVRTREIVDNTKNALNRWAYNAGAFLWNMRNDFRNKVTSQGRTDISTNQQQAEWVSTASENQNNINWENYNQKNKNSKSLNQAQLWLLKSYNKMNPVKITEFQDKFGKDYGQAMADMWYTESRETNVPKMEEDIKEIYNEKKKAMNSVEWEFQDRSLADMLEIMLQKARNTKDYDMIDKYEKLTQKHNEKWLTMAEANDMREEFSYKIKTKWGWDGNSDKIDLADNVYTAVRKFLETTAEKNGIKDLQKMNRDIAMRKYLSTRIGDKAERQSANNMMSINDWIMFAEAATNPQAMALFAWKKVLEQTPVKNAVLNAVVGRRENRTIDQQNRQVANKERMENIESANRGKELQQELTPSKTPALPNWIKLTKVTEIDARKPKNKVTKKNNKSDNNKKSDSSSSDDGWTPTGWTPAGTNPTNNQGGTPATDDTKNTVTKKKAVKSTEMRQEEKYLDIQTNKWSDTAPEYVMKDPSRRKLFEGIKDKVESVAFSQKNLEEKRAQADQYLLPNWSLIVMYKSTPTSFGKQYDYDIYTDKDGVLFIKYNVDFFPENARVSWWVKPNIKQEMTVKDIKGWWWIYDKWQEANWLKEESADNKWEESSTTKGVSTKNKVTSKKDEATAPKQEENQTKKFTYDEYGEVMNKIWEVEKKINKKLDKQYEQERAEKMSRFEELRDKEDKTETEWKELVKLQGELNNMSNKYDKLKEDELKKQAPELLQQKEELQQAFDRDWKAAMDKKMEEMEKPFNDLRDEFRQKLRDELWIADDVILDEKYYNSLTPKQKETADRINKEFADKYEELRKRAVWEEIVPEIKKAVEKKQEKPKKKQTKKEEKEARARGLAKPDGNLIYSSWERKYVPSLQEWLIRLTKEEWEKKFKEQLWNAFRWWLEVVLWTDTESPYQFDAESTFVYNPNREWIEDWEDRDIEERHINEDSIKDYEFKNGDLRIDFEDDYWNSQTAVVDISDFLNYSNMTRYIGKEHPRNLLWGSKNKVTSSAPIDTFEDLDFWTIKELKDRWDQAAIDLYEEMWIEDDALEELYKEMLIEENETPQRPSIFDEELETERQLSENETAQTPTIFEEDLEQMNLRELDENETPQANEEEMNKVTKKQPEKPKNLVTSRIEESNNTDSKAEQIFNTSMEQLKGAKKVSLWALGKVKQTEVNLDNWTTITYIDSSVGKGISQNAIIRVNSPEAWYKTYVVTKIPNNPAEIREWGNVLTDEQVDKVYDILQWKTGEVKVEDMKVDVENVENKKDPINAFLDNNEAIKNDPKLKYKYLSRLNDQTSWIDYSTDIRYNWTVAEKVQQTIDSFGKLSNWTRLPIKFSKNNYGNYIEVWSWDTGMASRDIGDDIEFEYAKFLYDNPEIRSPKEFKADWIREAIRKGNEIHKEVIKDAEEQKEWTPLNPEKYVWQQPTAEEWIEAVYNEAKKVSDYFVAYNDRNVNWQSTEYRNIVKAAQNALWTKLQFKSSRSKLYNDFVTNIREANGNEKQLRSIAKNLYIQKVKDDFKNNYNYPTEVTDKVPWLRTAKDNYDRYLKGRDTSFSGKDPRIDYSDKDRIWAWIKRQDWNQITAEQRREIVNGVLEYAKYMGIDMKKMSEDAGVTYVHLNWKHPFLTSKAVWLFHWTFKSISVWADMESYREKMGQSKDAKTETHTVPVVMAHEITHAIDSMFEWSLFSDVKTREMGRKMNEGRSLWAYWHSKEEITARMVEEYVDVMKGWKWYYNMRWYWNKDVFDNEIKPYVEQIFNEKFDGYKLTAKERNDIKLDEAQINKNSVTASALNRVTSK